MKKTYISNICSVPVLFALCGCTLNGGLWDDALVTTDKIHKEEIHSFGFTKPDSQTLTPNRLIMLGEKAVYVTEVTPEHALVQTLRATDLAQPFHYDDIMIDLDKKSGSFTAVTRNKPELCLHYIIYDDSPPAKRKDIPKLEKLGFTRQKNRENHIWPHYYQQCYGVIRGTRYVMKDKLPAEYRFKESITVNVKTGTTSVAGKVAGRALLTPLAVMGDIILFPIILPVLPFKN